MDDRRWQNLTRARSSYAEGAARSGGLPLQLYAEVSARCNLRCTMCAIGYDTRYASGSDRPAYFSPALFARLRPIFPSLLHANLFGLGEPLLNPHLVAYVRELADAGARVSFHTNGTLVDDRKAMALARAGVAHVTVSIDGATPATYEAIRQGAKWEHVLRGIRALVRAGQRYGRPTVDLAMVAMRANVHEIPLLRELGAHLGVRSIHIEPLLRQPGSPELEEHFAREHVLPHPMARSEFLCAEPWATVYVTTAGEVRTCCLNEVCFGNLHEQTFEEIWNGEAYVRFRERHARRESPAGCANCIANARVRSSPWFRATESVVMQPMVDFLPEPTHDVELETVTESFAISGRERTSVDRRSVTVMIDHTPVEMLSTATFVNERFTLQLPTHFLTEGAHVVWLRDREGRSLARREGHFRSSQRPL